MSQDLFAAFGDASSAAESIGSPSENLRSAVVSTTEQFAKENIAPSDSEPDLFVNDDNDDDFGDFEDAAVEANAKQASSRSVLKSVQERQLQTSESSKNVGKHPFADHMDLLFGAGEDEYDAGVDDLQNLANNPEAAVAYSKMIIAQQEAKRSTPQGSASARDSQLMANSRKVSETSSEVVTAKNIAQSTKVSSEPQISSNSNSSTTATMLHEKPTHAPSRNPDVLFDADDLSEEEEEDEEDDVDDDFGDFEEGPQNQIQLAASTAQLTLNDRQRMPNVNSRSPGEESSQSLDHVRDIGETALKSKLQATDHNGHQARDALPVQHLGVNGDLWADFESTVSPAPRRFEARAVPSAAPDDDAWDDFEDHEPVSAVAASAASLKLLSTPASSIKHSTKLASETLIPPTNIPPPALLLSAFPSIFSAAQDALFTPLSKLDTAQRHQLLSHPATRKFLQSHLQSSHALAHIVAGRKQRWKRDQILSQSMRMGPATAGGRGGGMKLAGIDKSEVAKEEREVLDAVRAWKAQLGRLKGALASPSMDSVGTKLPPVPEISEAMPVRALSAIEGGFTARHACALCGLKREERVAKGDVNVEDSFGEWWVDGMSMHVVCKNWWAENKTRLKSK